MQKEGGENLLRLIGLAAGLNLKSKEIRVNSMLNKLGES